MLLLTPADVQLQPFPHIVKEGILDEEAFSSLQREFPDDALFDENLRHEWGGGRINLVRGNPIFERFIKQSPAWDKLFHYVNSARFLDSMLELFGVHFASAGARYNHTDASFLDYVEPLEYSHGGHSPFLHRLAAKLHFRGIYDRIMRLLDSRSLYVTFDIARSRSGYRIPPHTDNRNKLIIGLIYFNDIEELGGVGGEFLIHRHKQKMPLNLYPRYPNEEETEVVKRLKPRANVGVFELNCNNSYHSTTPLRLEHGYRRFLYISVAQPYVGSAWK